MTGAKEYAEALFLLAKEDGVLSEVHEDLLAVARAISANPDYLKLLSTPALSKEERVGLIDESARGLSDNVKNLLKLLAEGRRVALLEKICDEYSVMLDESLGVVRAEAVTAIPLTEGQSKAISDKLCAMLAVSKVVLTNTVDPSILGGITLRYRGVQTDASVKERLRSFEAALKSIII